MNKELNIPSNIIDDSKWYEKYPKLNSNLFTYENSARKLSAPYLFHLKNRELIPNKYITNVANEYSILGYTLNPPITNHDGVAIMFEDKETFGTVWFHYTKYDI